MAVDYGDLDRRFTAHSADSEAVECMQSVRDAGRAMAVRVCQVTPEGRERALALTKIEEAVFWVNAAIAREGN